MRRVVLEAAPKEISEELNSLYMFIFLDTFFNSISHNSNIHYILAIPIITFPSALEILPTTFRLLNIFFENQYKLLLLWVTYSLNLIQTLVVACILRQYNYLFKAHLFLQTASSVRAGHIFFNWSIS